ncbi:hypothetical protein BU25DRAFT_487968 [Macroventuria anomochaeta]|uniref:Uncharacterized protein n=1 Tax=Macroventuria anomochaeta TaxID=301207 RepID=A0ACB6SEU2_9PLEO|nr:uncharacterized protein BU25DRAFT_487968 [Macroventuria anomochaeta]KAF2632488.1 hypothetical protein BU25DRAFT_487968 [Macroventuria anomochaeta]
MRKNNKWRRRIICLLDELLMDLQSRPPSLEQAVVIEKLAALSNRADSMFGGLKNVEITETLYYTRPIEIPKTPDQVVYKLEDYAEDTAFAIYCLFQDATYIRMFSARAWREFTLGAIGVQIATFCTNIAFAEIELMSGEFLKRFDRFQEKKTTRTHTEVERFFRAHCGDDERSSSPDAISLNCEDVDFARHANRRLGYYVRDLGCTRTTRAVFEAFLVAPGQFWGETQDDMRLLKSLCQLRVYEWQTDLTAWVFKADCMYSAANALVSGHIDTDHVFAAQMLSDIQQLIDPQIVGIEDILEQVSRDLHRLYGRYISEWNTENLATSHYWRTKHMFEQYTFLENKANNVSAFQDFMETWEKATGRQCTLPGFRLLRHAPLLIGQLVAQFRFQFQETFLDIANDQGHILSAIHLYHAAKYSQALQTERWEDMEWMIEHQCYDTIFAGEPPANNAEYASRFCLVYGLDPTKFAVSRKATKLERVKNDIYLKNGCPRRLESPSQFVRTYSKTIKAEDVKSLTSQWRITAMEEFADTQLDKFSPYGKPNNIGYLTAAKEGYESDEEALIFDIFDFHSRCSQLLRSIRDLCLEEAPEDYPAIRFGGEEGINPTLAELLRDLTECPRHHERMWPKAVALLRDLIEKEGGECCDMAWARMGMTKLESTSLDSEGSVDESESDTAMETPPPGSDGQGPEPDERAPGDRAPDASKSESSEGGARSHTLKEGSETGSFDPKSSQQRMSSLLADTEELKHLERQFEEKGLTFGRWAEGGCRIVAPDGTIVASCDPREVESLALGERSDAAKEGAEPEVRVLALNRLPSDYLEDGWVQAQWLIKEWQQGRMAMEILKDGNMEFLKDGKLKVLVTTGDLPCM